MDQSTLYPIQLLDVRLYEVTIERLQENEGTKSEEKISPALKIELDIVKRSERQLSVFLKLDIQGPQAQSPEFQLRFKLEGLFKTLVDVQDVAQELWQDFERASALTLLWPYARECADNFTHRMRIEMPVLPTLNCLAMRAQDST